MNSRFTCHPHPLPGNQEELSKCSQVPELVRPLLHTVLIGNIHVFLMHCEAHVECCIQSFFQATHVVGSLPDA